MLKRFQYILTCFVAVKTHPQTLVLRGLKRVLAIKVWHEHPSNKNMKTQRPVLLSIKPQYSEMILDGVKTVELRRIFNQDLSLGTPIVIYSSSPVKQIAGIAFVEKVERRTIASLWKHFGQQSGVSYLFFRSYFDGCTHGYAVVLNRATKLNNPIPLRELQDMFDFRPPQSYMYVNERLWNAVSPVSAKAA